MKQHHSITHWHPRRAAAAGFLLAILVSGCEDRTGPDSRPESVTLTPTQTTVAAFDTIILAATVRDGSGRVIDLPSVTWTTSDAAVATAQSFWTRSAALGVRFGTVLGVSPGSVTITATSQTVRATAVITVGPPVPVASVTVTPGSPTVTRIGDTLRLAATLRDASGNVLLPRPTTWSSDNEVVATVDPTGLVRAVGEGSATMTATREGVSGSAATRVVHLALAFLSQRDGNLEIYGMNPNGSTLIRLTNSTGPDGAPTWSRQGDRIAFQSDRDIYVMNADGGAQTRLNVVALCCMAWSPDGQAIAFTTYNPWDFIPSPHVTVVRVASGRAGRIARTLTNSMGPVWSPDGRKVAFSSWQNGNSELYIAPVGSGGTLLRLTNNAARDSDPQWAPNGQKIAFVSERDGNTEIYVMNADGSAEINLTNNAASDDNPQWSPDGQKIAFVSDRDGNRGIYVMNLDGSAQTYLTNAAGNDDDPQWSPDGQTIAFVSDRDGNAEIYVMNTDGSAQTNLTRNLASDQHPRWRP